MKYTLDDIEITEERYNQITEKIKEIEKTEYSGYLGDQVAKHFSCPGHVIDMVLENYYEMTTTKQAAENVNKRHCLLKAGGVTLEEAGEAMAAMGKIMRGEK